MLRVDIMGLIESPNVGSMPFGLARNIECSSFKMILSELRLQRRPLECRVSSRLPFILSSFVVF